MITLKITKEQVARAKERCKAISNLKDSITKGKSSIYGSLGEIIFEDYFKERLNVEYLDTYDYDYKVEGRKIDIKSKKTTVIPKGHYNCSVAAANTRQKCDYYAFVRIREDFLEGYILGYISKKQFYEKAIFFKEGEKDPSSYGNWTFKGDCYNLPFYSLKKFKQL